MSRTLKKLTLSESGTSYDVQVESSSCDGQGANIVDNYCLPADIAPVATTASRGNLSDKPTLYKYQINFYKPTADPDFNEVIIATAYSSESNLAGNYLHVLTYEQQDLLHFGLTMRPAVKGRTTSDEGDYSPAINPDHSSGRNDGFMIIDEVLDSEKSVYYWPVDKKVSSTSTFYYQGISILRLSDTIYF